MQLVELQRAPRNLDVFVEEGAQALGRLYGKHAAAHYRTAGIKQLAALCNHPHVDAWACAEGGHAQAMLCVLRRGAFAQAAYIHVLAPYAGCGIEQLLFVQSHRTAELEGAEGMVYDAMPLCLLDLEPAAAQSGFRRIPRLLMKAPLVAASSPPCGTQAAAAADWPILGEVLVRAYKQHPDRCLHWDIHTSERAAAFVQATAHGAYGACDPAFIRGIWRRNRCIAAALACEALPGVGFVVQVGVLPEFQGRGHGSELMRGLMAAFHEKGLSQAALGVTAGNPARRLYEGLGFQGARQVDAFVWWRGGDPPAA